MMYDYDIVEAGKRIRKVRKNLDWKQSFLAGKIKVSNGTLSKYENGIGRMTFEMANKIAEALGVDRNWILYGEEKKCGTLLRDDLFISRWRSIEEEKPENGQNVLAGNWYLDGWFVSVLEYWDGFNCSKNCKEHEIKDITHWMPLPMPPMKGE